MAWNGDERVQLIRDYVALRRQQLGIRVAIGYKLEFSCEAFGEFRNLLDVQLLSTPEFQDGWLELRESETRPYDPTVVGVLEEVRKAVERQLEREPTSQEWLSLAARLGRRGSA